MIQPTTAQAQALSRQPQTAAALLRLLGVPHAPVLRQRAVLADWLKQNTASFELTLSLRSNGFGILLPPLRHHLPLSAAACSSTVVQKPVREAS